MKKLAGKPFAIVGVNSDKAGQLRAVEIENKLTWRSFVDVPGSTPGDIARSWGVHSWPVYVLIDAKGRLRYRAGGWAHKELIYEAIQELMREAGHEVDLSEEQS